MLCDAAGYTHVIRGPDKRRGDMELRRRIAVDLGTARTRLVTSRGVEVVEATAVAVDARTNRVVACGNAGADEPRPAAVEVKRPVSGDTIADEDAAHAFVEWLLRRVRRRVFRRALDVTVPVSLAATRLERRALGDLFQAAGARSVRVIERPLAVAAGAGIPARDGALVVDVGAGVTDVALVAFGGLVAGASTRTGGREADAAVQRYLRREHGLEVGTGTAERVKIAVSSRTGPGDGLEIVGRDTATGRGRRVVVADPRFDGVFDGVVSQVVAVAREAVSETPPELAGDLLDRGIVLVGGAARLRGLRARLTAELRLPAFVADGAATAAARGAFGFREVHRAPRPARARLGAAADHDERVAVVRPPARVGV